jgi:hypothetical protein
MSVWLATHTNPWVYTTWSQGRAHRCFCCCSVAQAITKAIQVSVAATLAQAPQKFTVSPQAFYYCATLGGCSCKTGWVAAVQWLSTSATDTHPPVQAT